MSTLAAQLRQAALALASSDLGALPAMLPGACVNPQGAACTPEQHPCAAAAPDLQGARATGRSEAQRGWWVHAGFPCSAL